MKVNPDGLVIYAKRILDRAGYYAVKKDRVKTVTSTTSISGAQLAYSTKAAAYVEYRQKHMFVALAHELSTLLPVRRLPKTGDDERYYVSLDIILPPKD